MKTKGNNVKGSVRAALRAMANIIENPVWANYTHGGPGPLPTGQAGAAGRPAGPYIAQCEDLREHMDPASRSDWDYAMQPLRQY